MRQPDIILILPDQLRRDALGCYGAQHALTPHLDRLATEGLVVDGALSTCPVCTPYRSMLMTGRYPTHSGVVGNFVQLCPQQNPQPLAHCLAAAGYQTAYFGKWHLAPGHYGPPSEHPEFVPPGPQRLGFAHWRAYNMHCDYRRYWWYEDEAVVQRSEGYETDIIVDQALDFLRTRRDDRPVFLVLSPHPPHPPFDAEHTPPGCLERVPCDLPSSPNVPANNPRTREELRIYLAMLANFDDNVGRLLKFVDRSARADNTLMLLTSDHGEMHGSHGRVHKMVPYAEAVDVPLVMRWRRFGDGPRRLHQLLGPMDWLPTLCALAGAKAPTTCDGRDLSPQLLGQSPPVARQMLLANYSSHWNEFRSDTPATATDWRCWPEWRGVRTPEYTYVRWLDGREELFHDAVDPYQQHNLARDPVSHAVLADLQHALSTLLAAAHDRFPPGTAYRDWYDDHRQLRAQLPEAW